MSAEVLAYDVSMVGAVVFGFFFLGGCLWLMTY